MSSSFEKNKRRMLSEYENSIIKKLRLDMNENKSDLFSTLEPILSDEYSREIETELLYVGKISNKKETARLIKELSSLWPLEGKNHLKRVRRTSQKDIFEIILRPVPKDEIANIEKSYSLDDVFKSFNFNRTGLLDTVAVYNLPKYPPLTYKQYHQAVSIWPVQFRENKYIESVLNHQVFTSKEKEDMAMFMKMAIGVASYGDVKVGCVIVDPATLQVVAAAHDCREHHPIQHAAMVAIDLVAKSQGGGSWDLDGDNMYSLPYVKNNAEFQIVDEQERLIKKSALPYLCTGYDLYITREPCIMCAMALVHSRIRRVFYGRSTPWGALGTHYKIHVQSGLNHHFKVFKGLLKEDCNQF